VIPMPMRIVVATLGIGFIASSAIAIAQPAPAQPAPAQPAPAQPAATPPSLASKSKGEAEFLVPPGGGAFEVPVHALRVCVLSFAEKLVANAVTSSGDFEINTWGTDSVAVRANSKKAAVTTVALSTTSGAIKVNVTFRVVPETEEGLSLVRFKAVSAEVAYEARLAAELAKRMAPVQAELDSIKKKIDEQIRDRADGMIAERSLKRNEVIELHSHARNSEHVIAHVERALLFGEDAHLFFEIENRSNAAYRLARVAVFSDGVAVHGPSRLQSTSTDKDAALIGVVAAGASARGVVVVRSVDTVLRKSLVLELAGPGGRGLIRVSGGIVLR
jgi:hypothetical protein